MRGVGKLTITSDTRLDAQWTTGSVDIVYPDGSRLLADFVAPLTATE